MTKNAKPDLDEVDTNTADLNKSDTTAVLNSDANLETSSDGDFASLITPLEDTADDVVKNSIDSPSENLSSNTDESQTDLSVSAPSQELPNDPAATQSTTSETETIKAEPVIEKSTVDQTVEEEKEIKEIAAEDNQKQTTVKNSEVKEVVSEPTVEESQPKEESLTAEEVKEVATKKNPTPAATKQKPTTKETATKETAIRKAAEKKDVLKTDVSLVCQDNLSKTKKKPKKSAVKLSHQLILVVVLSLAFLLAMVYQTLFGQLQRPESELIVEEGQSYYGLLPQFQKDVPLFSANLAKLYIKSNIDAPLNSGTYDMPANPNLKQFLHALQQEQKIAMVSVQIIEGKTAKDLYQVLANTAGIEHEVLQPDGQPQPNLKQQLGIDAFTPEGKYADNLEGWFTPNTYHYGEGATDKQILIDLYTYQQQALDKAWENRAADLPYKTPYDALIMASIIEKETSVPSERAQVAAVFINRLNKGMRLQTDPTIIYGMGERYDGNIRRQDIDETTDYNTYQIDGLPPTPIALPSHASIEAAMHPATDDALYFVATGTGGHQFSKTLAEHNKAVRDYLKVMREKDSE